MRSLLLTCLAQYLFARLHIDHAFCDVHVARVLNLSVGSHNFKHNWHYDVQNTFRDVHVARITTQIISTFQAQLALLPTRL